jgi:hypothetical protein
MALLPGQVSEASRFRLARTVLDGTDYSDSCAHKRMCSRLSRKCQPAPDARSRRKPRSPPQCPQSRRRLRRSPAMSGVDSSLAAVVGRRRVPLGSHRVPVD